MSTLCEILKTLNPSQIDEAVQFLQSIKNSKELPLNGLSTGVHTKSDAQTLPGQNSSDTQPINESGTTFLLDYPSPDIDEVPLIHTYLPSFSNCESVKKPDKTKDDPSVKRKGQGGRRTPSSSSRIQDIPHITSCSQGGVSPKRKINDVNGKAALVKSASTVVPSRSLNSFGFLTCTAKTCDLNKNRMFPLFLPDKRRIPESLQFWKQNVSSAIDEQNLMEDVRSGIATSFQDQELSLLHPMSIDDSMHQKNHPFSFNDLVESGEDCAVIARASNSASILSVNTAHDYEYDKKESDKCTCLFHSRVIEPYKGFDTEVIFSGFFAVGYDPCQARPPYFGTYNNTQAGRYANSELIHIARFPVGEQMIRFLDLDYDYDSGDDWDIMDGEDIGASSSSDSEWNDANVSLDSSDLGFINDDDGNDSDCELYQRIIDARQRRLKRLYAKDKLVPLFSGPFVGIPVEEHPLQRYDRLELLVSLSQSHLSSVLVKELQTQSALILDPTRQGTVDTNVEKIKQKNLIKDALGNRREMTCNEINAMHNFISLNTKASAETIVAVLREQHICVGVARAEIKRTVKRYYERRAGTLVRRVQPWPATDKRLFNNNTKQKAILQRVPAQYSTISRFNSPSKMVEGYDGAGENIDISKSISLQRNQT